MKNYLFLFSLLLLTCSFTHESFTVQPLATTDALNPGGAYAMFAGKFGGKITREEIASHQQLTVDGCAKGSRIFTFTLKVRSGGKSVFFQTDSPKLTRAMHAKLKTLSTGDTFEFSRMKAYLPNGKDMVDVQGRKFTVI